VHFKTFYTNPTTKRDYGIVVVPRGGPQLPERAIAEGWLKIRDDAGRKDESDESSRLLERLQVSEARAKADSKGLWAESGGKIDCSYDLKEAKEFADKSKGQSVDGMCFGFG
jgi:staphylococcal nuclease domain-containing protein 1